ncbi:MAG: MarR family transcriptional regulator [archaeon]|jgi:uncharacterized membrane protein
MDKLYLTLLVLLCISTTAFSQEYYADLSITVSSTGEVSLSGITNHPDLNARSTQEFTSKKGTIWNLAINVPGDFSEYIYTIKFPEGTQIIDLNLPSTYRISTENNELGITGTGEKVPFFIDADYTINQTQNTGINSGLFFILGIIIVFGTFLYYKNINKNKTPEKKEETTKPLFNKDALTERQLQIVDYLEKHNGKATQAEIQKATNLPKASLSRNLDGLERKEIIQKERKGMTMLIFFKDRK